MARTGNQSTRKRSAKPASVVDAGPDESRVAAALLRTAVFQRVPVAVRRELDRLILLRPDEAATLKAIADRLELNSRFGVTLDSLKTYARRLEQLVRPVLVSHVLAGVLGCLPEAYRREMLDGSRVLLLSRVVKALSADERDSLSVADLGKLGSLLSTAGRSPGTSHRSGGTPERSTRDTDPPVSSSSPVEMAEAVRMLYGLSWPPEEESPAPDTKANV